MKYLQTAPVIEKGILTSYYKQEIKNNLRNTRTKSLARIKSLVTNHHGKIESQTATVLRVSLFMAVIILISF